MKRGSITIFMAMVLPVILLLVLTMIESARISGLKLIVKDAGDAAVNSLFGAYDRTLFDEYGLLFFDGGYGRGLIDFDAVEAEFSELLRSGAETGNILFGGTFFPFDIERAQVTDVVTATDYNGEIFIRSALDYFKFDLAGEAVDTVKGYLNGIEKGETARKQGEADTNTLKKTEWGRVDMGTSASGARGSVENIRLTAGHNPEIRAVSSGGIGSKDQNDEKEPIDDRKLKSELNDSVIGSAERTKASGWLSLVLPSETTVSGYELTDEDRPSVSAVDPRPLENRPSLLSDAVKRLTFCEYLMKNFSNYSNESGRAGTAYQIEYMIFGKENDRNNFEAALNRIMWMREGMNLLHLLVSEKRNQAQIAAETLVGWTGNAIIVGLTCTALLAAWAYAESILDVRALLQKKKVAFYKTEETWTLSFEGIGNLLNGGAETVKEDQSGLRYEDYLRMLLYASDINQAAYRAMDLIQDGMRRRTEHFLMSAEIYAIELYASFYAKALYTGLPVFRKENMFLSGYRLEERFAKIY